MIATTRTGHRRTDRSADGPVSASALRGTRRGSRSARRKAHETIAAATSRLPRIPNRAIVGPTRAVPTSNGIWSPSAIVAFARGSWSGGVMRGTSHRTPA
jgi:hypothetical protein